MKNLDYVIENYESKTVDGRDLHRLADFVPEERLSEIGVELKDEYKGKHKAKPFTRENILDMLKRDVEFGYMKAVDQRGISAHCMYECVKMWNWILEEGLEGFDDYGSYGMPIFQVTAEKYDIELDYL